MSLARGQRNRVRSAHRRCALSFSSCLRGTPQSQHTTTQHTTTPTIPGPRAHTVPPTKSIPATQVCGDVRTRMTKLICVDWVAAISWDLAGCLCAPDKGVTRLRSGPPIRVRRGLDGRTLHAHHFEHPPSHLGCECLLRDSSGETVYLSVVVSASDRLSVFSSRLARGLLTFVIPQAHF